MRKLCVITSLVVIVMTGCIVPPKQTPTPPPGCPYAPGTVQVNGDSLALHIARFTTADGKVIADRSQARSGFTYEIPFDATRNLPAVPSIGNQVKNWITTCGSPDLVIIEGGVTDLAGAAVPATAVEAAVTDLSNWLRDRNVPTLWTTVHPLPTAGTYMWSQPQRQAYNTWLKGGHVWGDVVDCVPALQDPAVPDTLKPAFWWVIDIFGTIDGVHPNQAGYQAYGACVSAAIPAALDG